MGIIKSCIIAFSMYSKIPMPQFPWKEEDMKYILCFFPWIGAVVGLCIYLWGMICSYFNIGTLCFSLVGAAIPIMITGGIHVDGFVDVMDAFHSYQSREKKLEILKDSHVGAFAVIMLGLYALIYVGTFSEISRNYIFIIVCAGFVLSRCLSGLGLVVFPSAKKDGLLFLFASNAQKHVVRLVLILQGMICAGFMLWQSFFAGGVIVLVAMGTFLYYYLRTKKEFGGITGDTAGYFVLICERNIVLTAAILNVIC